MQTARIAPDRPSSKGAIHFHEVNKVYETKRTGSVEALRDITLSVGHGEFVSLVGPSGCGKSTLLMLAAGLLGPSSGAVEVNGSIVRAPQVQMGVAFQQALLLPWRSVLSNLMIQIEARGLRRAAFAQRADMLLTQVGLDGFEAAYPRELSGGMQQRAAICRALIHDPETLLLDEPFGALDSITREQLMFDLHKLWYQERKSVLFITHDIAEAAFLSDRVVVISPRPGRIVDIVDVDITHPRDQSTLTSTRFAEKLAVIRSLLYSRMDASNLHPGRPDGPTVG
jgi:NitT/TauT family transport system ATP-binding protein